MAHHQLICPSCQEPLEGSFCKNDLCDFKGDVSTKFKNTEMIDPLSVLKGLAGTGRVHYDPVSESFILRGAIDMPTFAVRLAGESPVKVSQFAEHVRYWLKYTPRQYSARHAEKTLLFACQTGHAPIPTIAWAGDYPILQHSRETDLLYFPSIISDSSRVMGTFLYTGAPVTATDHNGLFDQWLATFRCATPGDREVLRAWCIGAMCQSMIPNGGVPGLLIVAHDNGAGKTASADMLAAIFGGSLNVYWASENEEAFTRKVLGGRKRLVLIDNLVAEGNTRTVNSSTLASLMTRAELTVKRLFVSAGTATCDNRFLYLLTANAPMMSPELLSRVIVLSLDKQVTSSPDWIKTWAKQRIALLEDLMWYCTTRWRDGPGPATEVTSRFPLWDMVVARVSRRVPTLRGTRPAIVSCYSWVASQALLAGHVSGVPISVVLKIMRSDRRAATASLLQQQTLSEDMLEKELRTMDEVEVYDKGGVPWARLVS